MKTRIISLVLGLVCFTISPYSIQPVIGQSETINPGAFNSVKITGNVKVVINNSTLPSLKVDGDAKDASTLKYTVEDNTLLLEQKGNGKKELVIYVSAPELNKVEATNRSKVSFAEIIQTDKLTVTVKDFAEAIIKTDAPVIDVYAYQQGLVRVLGNYTCSSTYLANYDVLVAKYVKDNGAEPVSVLTRR